MALVWITGNTVRDAGARPDNRPWKLWAASYQDGGDGGVITPGADAQILRPVAGKLRFKAEAGKACYLQNPDGDKYLVTIPESDSPLWPVIEAGVAFPPDTAQVQLNTAVEQYVETHREQFRTYIVPVDANDPDTLYQWKDENGVNVGDPVTLNSIITTAVAEAAATTAANTVTPDIITADIESRGESVIPGDTPGTVRKVWGAAVSDEFPAAVGLWEGIAGAPSYRGVGLAGNGTTDDWLALGNSDTAADASSLPLMLPPGVYRVSGNRTINSPVWFTPGAILKPDNGVTITLAGGVASAPPSKIFDHSAGGKVVVKRVLGLPVYWWGAVGDGVANDTAAIQAALDVSAITFAPAWLTGTHLIDETLIVAVGAGVVGTSADQCRIETDSPILMMKVLGSLGGYGNRHARIGGFHLGGAEVATGGLLLSVGAGGPVVQQRYGSIEIDGIVGAGLILDVTQNTIFESIDFRNNDVHILLLNGAGNNLFQRCEMDHANVAAVRMNSDNTYDGYTLGLSAFGGTPQANRFEKCVLERGDHLKLIDIIVGARNAFVQCDLAAGLNCEYMVDIAAGNGSNTGDNVFEDCLFHWSASGTLPIRNAGFRTTLVRPRLEGHASTTTVISTSTRIEIDRPRFSQETYVIKNTAGDRTANVIYFPERRRGTTAQRNPRGHTGFHYHFDTDLRRDLLWNGTDWIGADMGGRICGSYVNPSTPVIYFDVWEQLNITALSQNCTFSVYGTPKDGMRRSVRVKSNGGPYTTTWDSSFTGHLLATTVSGKTHIQELVYDAAVAKWVGTYVDTAGY